jgi:uncharacterized SAM-dependent methyltransferase
MAKPEAFVIIPYKEPFNQIYSQIIKTVLDKCGFRVIRADEIASSSPFQADIEKNITTSDLIIADVTGYNLNVYYELGMAYGMKKDVIILTSDIDSVPSDTKHIRHLLYDNNKLDELKSSFEDWVHKSRAYQFKSYKQTSNVLNRGEIFRSITDATFYLDHKKSDSREEIINFIRNSSLIPPKYTYKFDSGCALWLALCKDAEYKYFHNSISFFTKNIDKILDLIGTKIINNSPDLISLGPGNGKKDQIFLNKIIKRQDTKSEMYYYPFDINPSMISSAIATVTDIKKIADNIKIKAIVSDFSTTLKSFSPVYQYRLEPNIFTLLGNTLGNFENETNFLSQIRQAMFPEDVLIIEVRLQSDRKSVIGGSEELNKRFDFTPLEVIGVQYDPDKLKYDIYENRSTISGTQSIIASYHTFTMLGEDEIIESANLSYVHEYENPEVLSTVIESVGFEIVGTFVEKGIACFVLKNPLP